MCEYALLSFNKNFSEKRFFSQKFLLNFKHLGAEVACWAHNPKVGGSIPPSATIFLPVECVGTRDKRGGIIWERLGDFRMKIGK